MASVSSSRNERADKLTSDDIKDMKRCLDLQNETIEDLVRERDEICDDRFSIRKKLENAEQQLAQIDNKDKELKRLKKKTAGLKLILEDTEIVIASKVLFFLSDEAYRNIWNKFTEEEVYQAKLVLYSMCGGPNTDIGNEIPRRGSKRESKLSKDLRDITNALDVMKCNGSVPLFVITKNELQSLTDNLGQCEPTNEPRIADKTDAQSIEKKVVGPNQLLNESRPTHIELAKNIEIIDQLSEKIKEKLDTIVEEKVNIAIHQEHQYNSIKNVKVAIQEDRDRQMEQRKERKRRSSNVIIHGIDENNNMGDQAFVNTLFEAVNIKHSPSSMIRLGTYKQGSTRPLKLVMKNVAEKSDLMKALPRLKTARKEIRTVSITNDYTIDERKQIAVLVAEAKEKTANANGKYAWKVRGTPYGNLRLIKYDQTNNERFIEAL